MPDLWFLCSRMPVGSAVSFWWWSFSLTYAVLPPFLHPTPSPAAFWITHYATERRLFSLLIEWTILLGNAAVALRRWIGGVSLFPRERYLCLGGEEEERGHHHLQNVGMECYVLLSFFSDRRLLMLFDLVCVRTALEADSS